ncbi:hypothetical protein BYT27DRAFT_7109025 [Phlegmacium glaucopus]|nr:hypothetical protein BYT27DRAFT_7109025 [Phlegmacium glaucopus]
MLAGLTARIDLGPVDIYAFHRRQTTGGVPAPPECESTCNPVNSILTSANTCTPSQCCSASFENSYFNCFVCVATTVNLTDYSVPQSLIDTLYDLCASLGIQLPVLTFPGQNASRPLSSVQSLPSPQTPISTTTSLPLPPVFQTTIGPSTSPTTTSTSPQATATTSTPNPTSTKLSTGIRSMETSCFSLIASAMILGTWFYFAM